MYNSNNVANKIRDLAKFKKVTVKKLLEDVGLGFNTMANMKTSMPKADNLAKIADYLDCSVDYLLGRTDIPEVNRRAKIVSIAEQFENADTAKVAAYGESTHTIKDEKFNK